MDRAGGGAAADLRAERGGRPARRTRLRGRRGARRGAGRGARRREGPHRRDGRSGDLATAAMSWPDLPAIYEVNTAVWLDALSRRVGAAVTLGDVRPADW